MAEETGKRKVDHIQYLLRKQSASQKRDCRLRRYSLVHRALPEINKSKINLSTTFLAKNSSAPLIVGAMTGGTEEAIQINASIAEAVEKLGLGMGVREPKSSH